METVIDASKRKDLLTRTPIHENKTPKEKIFPPFQKILSAFRQSADKQKHFQTPFEAPRNGHK